MAKLVKMFVNKVYKNYAVDKSEDGMKIVDYINEMITGWNPGVELRKVKKDLHGLVDLINVFIPEKGIINTTKLFSSSDVAYIVGKNLNNMFKAIALTPGRENQDKILLAKARKIKNGWNAATNIISNSGNKNVWFRCSEEEIDELGTEDLATLILMRKLKIRRECVGLLPDGKYDFEIKSIETWDNQEDRYNDPNFDLKVEADKRIVSVVNNRYDKDEIFNKIELFLDYAKASIQDLSKDPGDRFDNACTNESWLKAGYDMISDGWKDGVVPEFYLKDEIDPAIIGRFLIKELVDLFKNGERVYNVLSDESFRILAETSENKKVNYLPINSDFYEAITELGVKSPSFSEASEIIGSIASEKNNDNIIDLYDIESVIGFEKGQKVLEWAKSIKYRLDKLQSIEDWTTVLNDKEKMMEIIDVPRYLWNKTYEKLGPNDGPIILNLVEFFDEVNAKLEME